MEVVVKSDRMSIKRTVRTAGIHRELLIPIGRLKIREERERPEQNILIPGPTAKPIVIAFDVFTLKLQPRETWRNIGIHRSLSKSFDVRAGLNDCTGSGTDTIIVCEQACPFVGRQIEFHPLKKGKKQSPR